MKRGRGRCIKFTSASAVISAGIRALVLYLSCSSRNIVTVPTGNWIVNHIPPGPDGPLGIGVLARKEKQPFMPSCDSAFKMTSALIARAKGGRVNLSSWGKWLLTALGEKEVGSSLPPKKFYALSFFFVSCVTKCRRRSIQDWLRCRVVRPPPISRNSRVASNYAVTLPGRQHTEGHDINCTKQLLQSASLLKEAIGSSRPQILKASDSRAL